MLEKLAKDKHSSLLQKLVNYGQKKFDNIERRRGKRVKMVLFRIYRIVKYCKVVNRMSQNLRILNKKFHTFLS